MPEHSSGAREWSVVRSILQPHLPAFFVLPIAVASLAIVSSFIFPSYTAVSTVQPVAQDASMSRFAGLAAQFGIAIPGGGTNNSVDFYARLLMSREVLEQVASAEYATPRGTRSLVDILEIDEADARVRMQEATDWIRDHSKLGVDITSGLLSLEVRARDADLAEAINRRLLAQVDTFNVRVNRVVGGAERAFMEQRAAEAASALAAAESAFEQFSMRNRTYASSPELTLEAARLSRQLDLAQKLYTSLLQALEQARIEEVRNTPVVTVVEAPEGSARRRRLFPVASLGVALGLFFAGAWVTLANVVTFATPEGSWARRAMDVIGSALRLKSGV